jgi:PIN domain nuclease of toxin-antitoxin system
MLNLDTHVLVHALAGELTPSEEALLRGDSWSVSAIVLWEIGKLAELGRIDIDLDDAALGRILGRIHIWPLTLDVCRAIRRLDVRSDPADEIIAATSLVHQAPLVTRDARLRRSRLVPLATPRRGGP